MGMSPVNNVTQKIKARTNIQDPALYVLINVWIKK